MNISLKDKIKEELPKGVITINSQWHHWDDLVLADNIKEKLKLIVKEYNNQELIRSYGIKPALKIGLYGKKGTGKTLIAKILRNQIGCAPLCIINFERITLRDTDSAISLLNNVFGVIKNYEGVFLFKNMIINENTLKNYEMIRLLSQFKVLLTDYEGEGLILINCDSKVLCNELKYVLDDIIHIPLPSEKERIMLFKKYFKVMENVNVDCEEYNKLTEMTDGFTGKDIERICIMALKNSRINNYHIDYELLKSLIQEYVS